MEWKGRRNVTWDACSKCVGGAERTGWDTLLEMETKGPVGEGQSIGATALVVDLAKAFEMGQLNGCVGMEHVY